MRVYSFEATTQHLWHHRHLKKVKQRVNRASSRKEHLTNAHYIVSRSILTGAIDAAELSTSECKHRLRDLSTKLSTIESAPCEALFHSALSMPPV